MTSSPLQQILDGDIRTLAKTLTEVESGDRSRVVALLKELFPHTGKAFIIGITGSPGTGKSTLVDQLARHYRQAGKKVGIIAVDPSSPFSGGAILGDRVRMQSLSTDPMVFIRSMATRGQLGGLSAAVNDALLVLDAAGYEILLVETVGVGQDEVDIVKTAHVTLVVLVPGMGDDIQTIKAGIMEIGEVLVLNKADRDGVLQTEKELQALLSIQDRKDSWKAPVVKTVATRGEGILDVVRAIEDFQNYLRSSGRQRELRARFYRERLLEIVRERVVRQLMEEISCEQLESMIDQVVRREADPYTVAEQLVQLAGRKISRGE